MYKITQEMKNEYQEARKAMIKQWDYLEKAIPRIKHWAKKNNCKIYKIECIPIFGEELDMLIFYKTNLELEMFKTKKITDLTKKEFITILEEIGYTTEFNNNIRINRYILWKKIRTINSILYRHPDSPYRQQS